MVSIIDLTFDIIRSFSNAENFVACGLYVKALRDCFFNIVHPRNRACAASLIITHSSFAASDVDLPFKSYLLSIQLNALFDVRNRVIEV